MKQRPVTDQILDHVKAYTALVPEGNLLELLEQQRTETLELLNSLTEEQGLYRYAPEKWSVCQVIGHVTDNERIFAYRMLRFARGDSRELHGYDENQLVADAPFEGWTLAQVAEDYSAVRQATLTLLRGLRSEDWEREGILFGISHSVLLLASVIYGHNKHHFNILQERYGIGL